MQPLSEITTSLTLQERALDFVRWLSCWQITRGGTAAARDLFTQRFSDSRSKGLVTKATGKYFTANLESLSSKAAIAAGTTTDVAWAGALVDDELAQAFFEIVRRATLLARIPGLRRIPFHSKVPTLSTDASYAWTAQGVSKAVSKFSFTDGVILTPTKASGIVVTTRELAEVAVPGLDEVLKTLLVNGLTTFTDRAFLDPAAAAVAGVRPASITNATTPIAGTGDLPKDLATLLAALYTGRPTAESAVLVMPPGTAAKLAPTTVPFGTSVITSPAAAGMVVALDPGGVFVADGGVEMTVSHQALIEMDSAPVGTAAAVLTSLFQTNLAGFRSERFVNWVAQPGAVKYLTVA